MQKIRIIIFVLFVLLNYGGMLFPIKEKLHCNRNRLKKLIMTYKRCLPPWTVNIHRSFDSTAETKHKNRLKHQICVAQWWYCISFPNWINEIKVPSCFPHCFSPFASFNHIFLCNLALLPLSLSLNNRTESTMQILTKTGFIGRESTVRWGGGNSRAWGNFQGGKKGGWQSVAKTEWWTWKGTEDKETHRLAKIR